MTSQPLTLAGAPLLALASGALYWPAERLLAVADLHLGKSERLARRGGTLLPPYETQATLDRLAVEIDRVDPARVVCLGDSFDDSAAGEVLPERGRLAALMAGRDWLWIAGNHDPAPPSLGGSHRAEARIGPLVFRHAAHPDAAPGEVSGHYHPKLRLVLAGRTVSRPCFLYDARRLLLPAFGAYTGGLRAVDPALARLLAPDARAILTGEPCVALPLAPALARVGRAGAPGGAGGVLEGGERGGAPFDGATHLARLTGRYSLDRSPGYQWMEAMGRLFSPL